MLDMPSILSEDRESAEKVAIDFLTQKKNPKSIGIDGVVLDDATGVWHVRGHLEDNEGTAYKFLVRVISGDDKVYDWNLEPQKTEG
jgi:hypothetical protein